MVHFKGKDIRKLSPGKVNLPGEKQVFRKTDENSRFLGDIIGLKNEAFPDRMVALLKTVMENGRITEPSPSLDQIRNAFARSFLCLDDTYKSLDGAREYPVDVSEKLMEIPDNIKIG
jgi:nicotinate phosphoribosyltransferase